MRAMRTIDLKGKTALVLGVANQRSLAWSIARALDQAGVRLAFTYQGDRVEENVRSLAEKCPNSLVMACDVASDDQMDGIVSHLRREFGHLDYLVHSIAFARREDLDGTFHQTSREGWHTALDISAYSLVALSSRCAPLMKTAGGGSILTMTYLASQRVFPNYNVMGSAKAALENVVRQLAYELGEMNIRVNAISAGPVATLSARGISGFTQMVGYARKRSPLGRNIEPREVADAALFLLSPMGSGITGTTLFVDAGYHIMGV
jgi:enoyl-[acyl-carrier protein] reductase I